MGDWLRYKAAAGTYESCGVNRVNLVNRVNQRELTDRVNLVNRVNQRESKESTD